MSKTNKVSFPTQGLFYWMEEYWCGQAGARANFIITFSPQPAPQHSEAKRGVCDYWPGSHIATVLPIFPSVCLCLKCFLAKCIERPSLKEKKCHSFCVEFTTRARGISLLCAIWPQNITSPGDL